jgi:prolyl-tRNA editing enzyme YbaK/EbsC (Cys-tRNA(Pro) deacylase)
MEIGGVTPFGLPDGVPILVDAGVMGTGRCIVGGGSRSIKIRLDPEVFGRMDGVTIIDDLARHPG